jgi:hypothetical protein
MLAFQKNQIVEPAVGGNAEWASPFQVIIIGSASLSRVVGTNTMRSWQSLKPIRFEGELLPDWAQLLDLAANLSSVPESTRQWFSAFTRQSGVDDARTIVDHCRALRSALHARRESVLSALAPGSGDSPPARIHTAWLYALDTMAENASGVQTCSWDVEDTDDSPGGFDSGGDITLRRV